MPIFVLTTGDYQYQTNIMATADVKKIAKKYVEIIQEGGYGNYSKHPYVQIWVNDEADEYPETFSENTTNEKRLVKFLSKRARELEIENQQQAPSQERECVHDNSNLV